MQPPSLSPLLPDHLFPAFVHLCIDCLCGRTLEDKSWVPDVFSDEETLRQEVASCQRMLVQALESRQLTDVRTYFPFALQRSFPATQSM